MKGDGVYALDSLWEILRRLRGEGGCPWDQKQTPLSMVHHLLGESYELADAVEDTDAEAVCEELGDVLFQLVFLLFLYEEKGLFTFSDVMGGIVTKLIRRHPHVFGNEKLDSADAVTRRWEEIKAAERYESPKTSLLAGIPRNQPALDLAMTVSRKVAAVGFDWADEAGVWDKVSEEMEEFREALQSRKEASSAMEFGDLLFSLVNVARFRSIDPEGALRMMVKKFVRRFQHMEASLALEGETPESADQDKLEKLWQAAKNREGKEEEKHDRHH